MLKRDIILSADGRAIALDSPAEAQPRGGRAPREFDFAKFDRIIRRNRWVILAWMLVALGAAIAVSIFATPIYQSTASLQLEQQSTRVLDVQELQPGQNDSADAERFLQTQYDILISRSLAIRVAERLGLFRNTDFLTAMGEDFDDEFGPAERQRNLREQVIKALRDHLVVSLPRNSRVVSITALSRNATLSARIANAYAEALIADNLERRFKASSYARTFLEQELAQTKTKLENSERAVITYARSAGLIDTGPAQNSVPGERARSLVTSSMVSMNESLSALTNERLRNQQRWDKARATPIMSLPEVLGNLAIQDLLQKRAVLRAEYEQQMQTRLPDFPSVRQAKAQVDELDSQIRTLATSIRNSIREAYEVSARQEQAAQQSLSGLRTSTLAEQGRSIQYNILRREVETNRQLYDGLLQRYKEVGAAAGVTANNISVVDTADAPLKPTWPKPILNVLVALFLGLIAAAITVFVRELLDDSITTPDDVESKLGVPLLGTIPKLLGDTKPLQELENQRSPMAEAYSSLRTSLEFASADGIPKSLLVTSSQPSEGKSTTSFAIARSLALIGRRVLLIDGDLRKPSLHKLLGETRSVGFSNVLNGATNTDELILKTGVENLFFLPSGPTPPNPADLYGRASTRAVIERLGEQFDTIVIDAPPVLGLADAPLASAMAVGTVFLVDTSQSHRGRSRTALRRLQRASANVLGVVLTKFDARMTGYANYGYEYEYGATDPKPKKVAVAKRLAQRF